MNRAIAGAFRRLIASPDLAVDVGTATTRLCTGGQSRLFERPSVACRTSSRPFKVFGGRVHRDDKPPVPVPALRAGVVVDCEAAAAVIETLFHSVRRLGLVKPRVLACAPTDVSAEERSALVRAVEIAGGTPIEVVPEPLAAAIGADLDISSPYAQMIVDIGEGVTDIAIIRSGRLIHTSAIRVACSDLHSVVRDVVSTRYGADLSVEEAARLTRIMGAMFPSALPERIVARSVGKDGTSEIDVAVRHRDLWSALDPVYIKIVGQIGMALSELTPSVSCEVIESGICLTGGGALLRGISDRILAETRISTRVAEYPMRAVISGAKKMLSVLSLRSGTSV